MSGSVKREKLTAGIIAAVLAAVAIAAAAGAAQARQAGNVIRHPRPTDPLAGRLEWALGEAKGDAFKGGFWAGFSIRRLMGEHSYIGSIHGSGRGTGFTLEELIYGKRTPTEKFISGDRALREAAERALEEAEGRPRTEAKVTKEIAVLVRFPAAGGREPAHVDISNMTLSGNLRGLPLFWLGPAADTESVALLKGYYEKAGSEKAKESLLWAVSVHQNPDLVIPFLDKILNSREPEEIRKDAAIFLGEQDDPRALDLLKKALASDPSSEVRENAVWGLNEMTLPAAEDLLIETALKAKDGDVREHAVQALAEKASRKAVAALEKIAFDDRETEIQKQAVYAFSDLPGKEGLPYLIKIAKTHHNPEVRKAAIYALGDSKDPEAVKALIDIVKGK